MKVLIVKLSSMGDLIHALPAISDAVRAVPGIEFDWVVDESFAEIPQLHPAVKTIIKSSHRRWSRTKWKTFRSGELRQFWRSLRAKQYDLVIDAQSNLKSAFITRLCRGVRCGTDRKGAREFGVHLAYQRTFPIPHLSEMHAVTRLRLLFSMAIGYPMPETEADYGFDSTRFAPLTFPLPKPYLVFLHSTTWNTKHWPERYWTELIVMATKAGYHVVLPWGSQHELERSERLGKAALETTVVPYLSIFEKGALIAGALGVVTVDTGLGHLTAVLNKPGVHIYGPTEYKLVGITTSHQKFMAAQYPCAPCFLYECKFGSESACFVNNLPPNLIWENMLAALAPALA